MIRKFLLWASFFVAMTSFAQSAKEKITLSDITQKYTYYPATVRGLNSMADGIHYSVLEGDTAIVKYSYKTGKKVAVLFNVSDLKREDIRRIRSYEFNADETKLIFYVNRKGIYRRSFTARFFVWDIVAQKLYAVSDKKEQQLATLSPDGSKVAFVWKNNLYYTELATGAETAVTTDGEWNKIINGAPDWVYEEEFSYNQAFDWSPDSKYLAYCKFDESEVPLFNMTVFSGLYPTNYAFKYPKAGDVNSVVTVHSYHLATQKTILVNVGEETDQYIPRLLWSPNGKLVLYRVNRLQNQLEFLAADAATGESKVFYTEKNERYIDENFYDNLTFIDNGSRFIYTSERNGYTHLYMYNDEGEMLAQITDGEWDVTEYLGFDAKRGVVYYQSAQPLPTQRSIYAVRANGSGLKKLNAKDGTNDAVFSANYQYYINYYSSANVPTKVTLNTYKGNEVRVLEDNQDLKMKLAEAEFSPKEFFTFTTKDAVKLYGWMVKPADFDATKKYPVLVVQYSGPNSQQVSDAYSVGWEQTLAAEGYIVASIDPRGTGARGEDFKKATYLELGKYETIDQIEGAKYLGSLPYVDATRIGIWGWSFGGFMTLNCLTQGADYFKMGIAVAPVTNWRYYDNIYTERFMRKPQDNADGYDNNSPINHVDKLKGELLLVHGTADDNVHLQNSIEISEALVQANKQFEQFYYTNKNHSIYGGNTRYHLYTKMLNFVKENL